LIKSKSNFLATDGMHSAEILEDQNIRLKMIDALIPDMIGNDFFINTGSPHYVHFASRDLGEDFLPFAKSIRHNARFKAAGVNVNVAWHQDGLLHLRTFERGVEAETLACGTGATAVALCEAFKSNQPTNSTQIKAVGGMLKVEFTVKQGQFTEVHLTGNAIKIFEGSIAL